MKTKAEVKEYIDRLKYELNELEESIINITANAILMGVGYDVGNKIEEIKNKIDALEWVIDKK